MKLRIKIEFKKKKKKRCNILTLMSNLVIALWSHSHSENGSLIDKLLTSIVPLLE